MLAASLPRRQPQLQSLLDMAVVAWLMHVTKNDESFVMVCRHAGAGGRIGAALPQRQGYYVLQAHARIGCGWEGKVS